jgi:hypothetical protein
MHLKLVYESRLTALLKLSGRPLPMPKTRTFTYPLYAFPPGFNNIKKQDVSCLR